MELEVIDLSRGGAGVAKSPDGRTVFIPLTAPGDRVRVQIIREEKRYLEAEMLELIRPSPDRVAPPCPVFGRCGGCQWQHLPYPLQWKTKQTGVLHALTRVGVWPKEGPTPFEPELFPSDPPWAYRNRIQLRGEGEHLGFFARRSHELVPIDACPISRPELNAAIPRIKTKGMTLPEPYKVEIEVTPTGEVRESWNRSHGALGFRQVHDSQNTQMREWVAGVILEVAPQQAVFDLYGGSGNLSELLLGKVPEIDCVDLSSPKLPPQGRQGTELRFHRNDVLPWLYTRKRKQKTPRGSISVILDPPRIGLGRDGEKIIDALEHFKANVVVAVGCDPDSWARDVHRFTERGWKPSRIAIFDLFPQTSHVESVALLMKPF